MRDGNRKRPVGGVRLAVAGAAAPSPSSSSLSEPNSELAAIGKWKELKRQSSELNCCPSPFCSLPMALRASLATAADSLLSTRTSHADHSAALQLPRAPPRLVDPRIRRRRLSSRRGPSTGPSASRTPECSARGRTNLKHRRQPVSPFSLSRASAFGPRVRRATWASQLPPRSLYPLRTGLRVLRSR